MNAAVIPECIKKLAAGYASEPAFFEDRAILLKRFLSSYDVSWNERVGLETAFVAYNVCSGVEATTCKKLWYDKTENDFALFSCLSMLVQLRNNTAICTGCPYKKEANHPLIDPTNRGFVMRKGKQAMQLTNFSLILRKAYISGEMDEEDLASWSAIDFTLVLHIQGRGPLYRELKGVNIGNLQFNQQFMAGFMSSHPDIWVNPVITTAQVRGILMTVVKQATKDKRVYTYRGAGIHKVKGKGTVTYAFTSPSGAILPGGVTTDSVKLLGNVSQVADILTEYQDVKEEVMLDACSLLLQCARPEIIGTMVGWTMACHLKEHLQESIRQFPLLAVTGKAGSGKTSLASLVSAIGGADYRTKPIIASTSSAPTIKSILTATTTVPRVLDECGRNKMAASSWKSTREVLKAAFQGGALLGAEKDGSRLKRITSPVWFLATESIASEIELSERSVQVYLPRNARTEDPKYSRCFTTLHSSNELWSALFALAREAVKCVLKLNEKQALARYRTCYTHVPDSFDERARIGYTHVLLGLMLLEEVYIEIGASQEHLDLLYFVRNSVREEIYTMSEMQDKDQPRSEVEGFFQTLIQLIASHPDRDHSVLREGHSYLVRPEELVLDLLTLFGYYSRYCNEHNLHREYTVVSSLEKDLEDNPTLYLGKEKVVNAVGKSVNWYRINKSVLEARGIEVGVF